MSQKKRNAIPKASALLCGGLALLLTACGPVQTVTGATATLSSTTTNAVRPVGWADESHSNDAEPNYDIVFPKDAVNQITITVTPEDWAAMQANMTELYGEKGTRQMGGPPPGAPAGVEQGQPPAPPEGMGPGGQGGPPGDMTRENPMWVAATIEFNGETWTNVGVRYKGNSSLMSMWGSGSAKLPFKLDFDEFEDTYPEIKNQRFYGFDQLSLGNNFSDATYMRDTIAYDLLEKAGLPAAETAFYEVVVDYGEGPVSLGIYTAVEVIDDTVIAREFGDDSGNIYEADGRAASLADGTADLISETFEKENNKNSDWSDIQKLYDVLHSSERTTDPAAWRSELESVFDVDGFLEWLALSGVMQHWDTYGGMTHNYYLYHDPDTGKLTWVSWDHNMILSAGGGGQRGRVGQGGPAPAMGEAAVQRGPRGGMGPGRSITLDRQDVTDRWPLIRFLLDDPTYQAAYVQYVAEVTDEVFVPDQLTAEYQRMAALLAPYAEKEGSQTEFESAVQALIAKTHEQAQSAATFVAAQATGTDG